MTTFPVLPSRTSKIGESLRPARILERSFSTCELLVPRSERPEARKTSLALNWMTGADLSAMWS
jgi:hypothetical protein